MIFSGHITEYKCEKCNSHFREVIPTSLLPAIVVVGFCVYPWTRVLMHAVSYWWLALPAAVVVSGVCLYSIDLVIDLFMTWKQPGQGCPRCHGTLHHAGGGFYDSLAPNLWEFVVYALSLTLATGMAYVFK